MHVNFQIFMQFIPFTYRIPLWLKQFYFYKCSVQLGEIGFPYVLPHLSSKLNSGKKR